MQQGGEINKGVEGAEETLEERMARLHPEATSKNIPSRRAIRALKKEDKEKENKSKTNLEMIEGHIDAAEDSFFGE